MPDSTLNLTLCDALTFLLDNIFIQFGNKLHRQVIGIPMGTYCAPLVAELFLLCYERNFMMSLSDDKQADIFDAFNTTSGFFDDILNINNIYFDNMVSQISFKSFNLIKPIPLIPRSRFCPFLTILFLPRFMINLAILISHFKIVILLALRPMEFIFLNLSDLLEQLAMLLTSTLAIYCKLRNILNKAISIINYDLISKFHDGLKFLLHLGPSEPEFYGGLVYKLKKIVGTNNFSSQFIKMISHYKKIGYNINVLQQTACLVVNSISVGNSAFLFKCTLASRTSCSMSIDEMVWTPCCGRGHLGLTVGFLLLRYSVLCTVESLSLIYLLFTSRFLCTRK